MKILKLAVLATSVFNMAACVGPVDAVGDSIALSRPGLSRYGAEKIGDAGVTITSSAAVPAANAMGVTGTINTHDADTLYASIEEMVGGLGQREQLAFMEAFFRVAYFDRCDIVGEWGTLGNSINGGRRRYTDCLSTVRTSRWSPGAAETFVSERRMDNDRAYVASNAFGSWTGGHPQRESYVNFILEYGDVIEGTSAYYIFQRNKDIMNATAVSLRER